MSSSFLLSILTQGAAFAALAFGVFLSSRILRFSDISPDGSFPLGAAVAAVLVAGGNDPWLALVVAFAAGAVAGLLTAVLHTRLGVTDLLAGILVMTALYSVNLHVMGKSNVSLLDAPSIVMRVRDVLPAVRDWPDDRLFATVCSVVVLVIGGLFAWFLRTDFGLALRAVGDNPAMVAAQGIDRRRLIEFGLALSNGFVAVSGALVAQYQGFADANMGVGTLVTGMAAVILGDSLSRGSRRLGVQVACAALGALLFRGIVGMALRVGLNPIDLKVLTALFVLVAIVLPRLRKGPVAAMTGAR